MPRLLLQRISATLFWLLVVAGLLWLLGTHVLAGMDYSLVSVHPSPNGKLSIHEFKSLDDGRGHAPYGQILALSHGSKLTHPENGFVFFAGYCKEPLQFGWNGNENVSIHCVDGNREGGPRTLASVMYGVKVSYLEP